MVVDEYRRHFDIPTENTLKLVSSSNTNRHSNDDDYYDFEETDPSGRLVHTYSAWAKMKKFPPFKSDNGFVKFAADGTELSRKKLN